MLKKGRQLKSEPASIENIKRFFVNNPHDDFVLIEDAFRAWGRKDPEDMEKNKQWLSNVLYHLRYWNLISPVYSYDSGRKKLDKLRLTLKGKQALGRLEDESKPENGNSHAVSTNGKLTLGQVMAEIPRIKQENPGLTIKFEVTLDETKKGSSVAP